ncbi:karyogamy protein kar9 [Yamadazyma tenuis]|uniref:karyogamy protein kar9 n=1 Tax=Candida tenuis TaxID=2315449 RepID=UPI00279B4CA5|nr:karyogamy protein kar9 [Yamadazyma tenuis]
MSAPRFSFFEELIQIPSPESELPNHQVHTINKIVDDIGLYLKELQSIFSQIKMSHVEATVGLEWYYEGKDQIHQLSHNLTNIDSMLTRLLVVLEAAETSKHIEFNHLLNKFEESTDLLLEVKKSMIVIKRKTEISINYKELEETTMWTLNNEIEECLKMFLKLKDLRALSPSTQHKSLSLPEILQRMQTDGSRGLRSVSLPTSSEVDESINTEFGNLESRLEPLKVSINFLPLRIEEFERMSSSWFPEAIATIHQSQTKLMSRWYYFLGDLQQFKKETIDAKWNTIFEFLISRASEIIDGLVIDFEQKANRKISKKIGENYKLCSSTISIVKESVVEKLLNDPEIIHNFNDQLLDKWNLLNDILMRNQKYDDAVNFASSEFTRLKSLQIARTSHSPVRAVSVTSPVKLHLQENDVVPGLGIDLGIDVENSHVPFSIKNSTKVRDFQQRYTIPKSTKPNLLQEFKLSKNTSKEDDEETLVTKTPKLGALTELMESVKLSEHRPSQHEKLPSRIPQIVKNYTQLGLPFVPKKTPHFKPAWK